MIILTIDTSTSQNIIALIQNGELVTKRTFATRSQNLVAEIDALLKQKDVDKKDLGAIAIGHGPGSFTGTRIGVVVAKSMSFALNLPLIPFNSMLLYAPPSGAFSISLDAKSKQCYTLKGIWKDHVCHIESCTLEEAIHVELVEEGAFQFDALTAHIAHSLKTEQLKSHNNVEILYLKNP